jgi:DNA-binding NarL/FixJ family response regulator
MQERGINLEFEDEEKINRLEKALIGYNGLIRNLNKPIEMVLASGSNLFLEGIRKILQDIGDIRIVAEALNCEEVEKYITEIQPGFLFIDNKTLKVNTHRLLNLITKRSPDTKVITFGNHAEEEVNSISYINKETNISELISIVKGLSKNIQTKQITDETKYNLSETEVKVIALVGSGLRNKKIAKKLSVEEKTVKAHLTRIFMKLGLHSRYQLIVYARQLKHKVNEKPF